MDPISTTSLEDPDAFPGRCRDPNAQRLVREAVRSHQTGAQRAAVVSTWIAVVYDVFGKLRELAQSGDAAARTWVENLDRVITAHDIASAQRLESSILNDARDKFGLLSANEHSDLERLYEDRHRCAHPSLNRPEEIYSPSPELVRLHLRNAVTHLLSQPPVQGRAALEYLQQEVDSDLFPKSTTDAAEYLRAGIFRRMKPALVRDFCGAAIAACLTDMQITPAQFARRIRGINALRSMSADAVNQSLREKLTPTVRRTPDSEVHRVIRLVASISDTCSYLESDVQMRVLTYIGTAKEADLVQFIRYALVVSEFSQAAHARIGDLVQKSLQQIYLAESHEALLNFASPPSELLDRVIELYTESGNWATSNSLAQTLIVPYSSLMNSEQISRILSAYPTNQELYDSATKLEVLRAIHATGLADRDLLSAALQKCKIEPATFATP